MVKINWVWNLLNKTIIPFSDFAQSARYMGEKRAEFVQIPDSFISLVSKMTVLNGPFAGMKYPEILSIGSTIYPKILGSYEKELEPLIKLICDDSYTEIVDIGCAEGYYAVGLAMRIKSAKVFAFDINPDAIRLCRAMASLNGVNERLATGAFCDSDILANLPLTEKALIISDCEGYEKKLFTKNNVQYLSQHELLIEVHDFIDIDISDHLRNLFKSSHDIQVISSIDDIKKARTYQFTELERYPLNVKKQILREGRPTIMEWFYMKPKSIN